VTSLDTAASGARGGGGFVVLGIPDVNGAIRGKALRPAAFKAAVEGGAVVTDLLLALDPADQPITDYERFGIRSGAAIRVIRSPRPERCRIECRRPGADANPYLALAALAAAAADGIQRGAQPPPPVTGDASERPDLPPLPASLESALQAFLGDGLLRHSLGESFSEYYAVSRTWELKAWQQAVSDWERDRYERAV
jgi:hypothetical protein